MIPGETRLGPTGRARRRTRAPTLAVANGSRRVVRVSSHYPFERVNPRLASTARPPRGFRLDVPAGDSSRWAPGETRRSTSSATAGARRRPATTPARSATMTRLSAEEYRARYGPTTGDRVRLGDTDLWLRVERDRTARATSRSGATPRTSARRMAQADRPAGPSELDVVIAGVARRRPDRSAWSRPTSGSRTAGSSASGGPGNPDISDGIDLSIGPHTEPIMGYGLIATPGAVDIARPPRSPRSCCRPRCRPASTTLITAGFEEPPRRWSGRSWRFEAWPLNIGLQAGARAEDDGAPRRAARGRRGRLQDPRGLRRLPRAHRPDPAPTPTRTTCSVASTPTACTSRAELEDTVAAIAGRTVHAYHVEGTGGGHVPDLIGLVREPSILCSSTTPTLPYGVAAAAEHVADDAPQPRRRSWAVPGDVALVRERIHPATMAAEGPLHELGAIAIVNSDSQGMGRIGETLRRTFQLAHVMKAWRRVRGGRGLARACPTTAPTRYDDNARVLRYLAKVHDRAGDHPRHLADEVGSLAAGPAGRHRALEAGVLRRQAGAGAQGRLRRPGGRSARATRSLERAEPTRYRPDWGGHGRRRAAERRSRSSRRPALDARDRGPAGDAAAARGGPRAAAG